MDPFGGMSEPRLGAGWAAFADPDHYLHYTLILIAATISGAVLAYHPVHRGRPLTAEDAEQRKTLVVYSVVGALIAVICAVNPSMALVIFGIGGLMRFRTDVGAPKSTGHTIVATLIGLCWGLRLELVAVLATAYVWALTWALESNSMVELTVGGVAVPEMGAAADAYRTALGRAGCRVTAHRKDFRKEQMTFAFRVPRGTTLDSVVREVDALPPLLRGTPDWPA